MGKAALIAIVSFAAMSTYYSSSSKIGMLRASERVADYQYETLARGAAVNGFNLARQALSESFTSRQLQGVFGNAVYSVQISVTGNRADISSIGQETGARGDAVAYEVSSEAHRTVVLPPSGPNWMHYGVISEGDLTLKGDIDAVVVTGTSSNELNANIHTNGILIVTGNAVDVNGFGTYHIGASGNPDHLEGAFEPNYNPTSRPGHYQTDYVEIPVFDPAQILSATGPDGNPLVDRVETSSLTLSGDHDFGGSRQNPYVIHVQGDFNVSSNTILAGYVMFVVDGNVNFSGNFTNSGSGYSGEEESAMAIYAAGNVTVHGSVDVDAQIFCGGQVSTTSGTPTITGSIVTKSVAELKGTPSIVYRPPSAALATPWLDMDTEIELVAYFEK